jgi:hypothetical protein
MSFDSIDKHGITMHAKDLLPQSPRTKRVYAFPSSNQGIPSCSVIDEIHFLCDQEKSMQFAFLSLNFIKIGYTTY